MTSDDDRVEYLAGGPAAGTGADPELDDVRDLLADPALWAEPTADLEDAVVAAVTADAARAPVSVAGGRRRSRSLVLAGAAAAAIVLAVGVGISLGRSDNGADLRVALAAPAAAGAVTGEATLTQTDSGWRIELSAPDLPRLADGRLYAAWLRAADGTLVAVGTFNDGEDVVLWAGVSPEDFPTMTVTREDVGGDPGSSGDQVLVGPIEDD